MFDMLGLFIGLYTAYAAATGKVYAKSGVWGKAISKAESPYYFWVVIGVYACLAIGLVIIF